MDSEEKTCPSCREGFNIVDRIPKFLPCSHRLCDYCIKQSLINAKVIICVQCRGESFNDPPIDRKTFQIIEENCIDCSYHDGSPACYLDSNTLESFCLECYNNRRQKNLVNLEETQLSTIMTYKWRDILSEIDKLPYFLKKQYWESGKSAAKQKRKIYFNITIFNSTEIFCEKHPFSTATSISKDSLISMCQACSQKNSENLPLDSPEIIEYAYAILREKIYHSDSACIPSFYYKYIKEFGWRIKHIIDLNRCLRESEGEAKITSKTKCPICLTNFGFGWDTPIKLSCSEANHTICLKCFKNSGSNPKCPLDDIQYEVNDIVTVEVDDLFSYPWCRGCYEMMVKDNKIPVKSKCIHPMCSDCLWCKICEDNVVLEPKTPEKCLIKNLVFMESYCFEHNKPAIKYKKELLQIPMLDLSISTPKVTCIDCKGGNFSLKNKDYFKRFDSEIRESFIYLIDNLARLYEQYQNFAQESKNNFLIMTYNERLKKIQEVAKLLTNLSQCNVKNEKIIRRFEAIYPYDGKLTKGWRICQNQVESIVLTFSLDTTLLGLILGGDVSGTTIHADIYLIEGEQIYVDTECHMGNFEVSSKEEYVRFQGGIQLAKATKYTLSIIYDNKNSILYNGNPAQKKCKLECSALEIQVENPPQHGDYRCYRNDLGGPIIGFIFSI